MTEDEARKIQRALELVGLPGEAAEVGGEWRIVDPDGQDIVLSSLDALIEKLGGGPGEVGWNNGHPARGFIFPEEGRG